MGYNPESGTPSVRADIGREEVCALFGNSSLGPVLRLLASEPGQEFSLTEIIRKSGLTSNEGGKRAVDGLIASGWAKERREGTQRLIRVNQEILVTPPNPYVHIPEPFRDVTRHFVRALMERSRSEIWKVLLFGGLAVGRGDRQSDIDILVVTPSPRPVRVAGYETAKMLQTEGYMGNRYSVHLLVETPETLRKRRADPNLARLLRQSVRLWDDPRHPLEPMLPEGGGVV